MGSSDSKKATNSIQAQKINEFFSYYGHKSGPQIQPWIQGMYSPNFYGSTTLNFTESKTTSIKKQDLGAVYERAFKGKYRPHSIQFQKVDPKARIIYYKWTNNTPHVSDSSRRVQIPFESYVVFDQNYRILKTVHNHCPVKKVQSDRPGYWQKTFSKASNNIGIMNNLLAQNNYSNPDSLHNRNYEDSQKRFRQNQNKQATEYNNWVQTQNNRGY